MTSTNCAFGSLGLPQGVLGLVVALWPCPLFSFLFLLLCTVSACAGRARWSGPCLWYCARYAGPDNILSGSKATSIAWACLPKALSIGLVCCCQVLQCMFQKVVCFCTCWAVLCFSVMRKVLAIPHTRTLLCGVLSSCRTSLGLLNRQTDCTMFQPWVAEGLACVMQGGGSDGENPKAAAVREQLRKRLGEQEEKERATKTELVQKAASYLEQFYEVGARSLLTPWDWVYAGQAQWYACWLAGKLLS